MRKDLADLIAFLSRNKLQGSKRAFVLIGPPHSPYDTLVLDQGSLEGVAVGQAVLFQNVALGEISEVFSHTSKAKLFSTAGTDMEVVIGPNHVHVEASGRGGGNFIARLPKSVSIQKGDTVT